MYAVLFSILKKLIAMMTEKEVFSCTSLFKYYTTEITIYVGVCFIFKMLP